MDNVECRKCNESMWDHGVVDVRLLRFTDCGQKRDTSQRTARLVAVLLVEIVATRVTKLLSATSLAIWIR